MRGKRQDVHLPFVHVDPCEGSGLNGVDVERHATRSTDGADLGNRLDRAYLVVGGHDADEHRPVGDGRLHGSGIDQPIRVNGQVRDLEAVALKQGTFLEHRLVLDGRRDDVLAPRLFSMFAQTQQCEVVALGCPAGENHFLTLALHDRRHLIARPLDRLLCPRAVFMGPAARIPELLADVT